MLRSTRSKRGGLEWGKSVDRFEQGVLLMKAGKAPLLIFTEDEFHGAIGRLCPAGSWIGSQRPCRRLNPQENIAASSQGARPIAISSPGDHFPFPSLNDGTPAPWGAADGLNDVYAAVILPAPHLPNGNGVYVRELQMK